MQTQRFEGFQCWNDERIAEVINTEAVAIDAANFLATHVPLHHIRYEYAPTQATDTSEQGLLNELLSRGRAQQHTFMVVLGIPGTGKSHLIRWLKERYTTINRESGSGDEVLLIERARSSLRGTLEQILTQITKIPSLDNKIMRDHLDRLRQATVELSRDELADTILNELQVAAKAYGSELQATEQTDTAVERLIRRRIQPVIEKFLLDFTVREHLKQDGGPIHQLVHFLSAGTTSRAGADITPQFKPDQLLLDVAARLKIRREGYDDARRLADDLQNKVELRDALAGYLNRLISRAVAGATKLSADDLKQMFNEVRRHLRQQARGLVLFVEDITAFTGLDAGLIDVLATQHTGEGNRDFCRLTSVIGITDSYYNERFPTNIKQRVSHRMTLNAVGRGQDESGLLQSPSEIATFAGRYLNALRLPQGEIERWYAQGAHPDQIPNACATCPFQQPCHHSFGAVVSGDGSADGEHEVGLYPFSQRALANMYDLIDLSKFSRTPRSLLTHVLQYVLVNHGPKVPIGQFPPRPGELGHAFGVPSLAKPGQERIIMEQGRASVERLQSLIRFWGDGTVDSLVVGGQRLVGGLSQTVFDAFSLPFIKGDVIVQPEQGGGAPGPTPELEDAPPEPTGGGKTLTVEPRGPRVDPSPAPSATGQTPADASPTKPPRSPLLMDIDAWYRGGKLQRYNDLAGQLSSTLRSFIDWECYGINAAQVTERCQAQRLVFEDQAGQPKVSDYLRFARSLELYEVLVALASFETDSAAGSTDALGGHIVRLGSWLRAHEDEVVEFVRRPHRTVPEPRPLVEVLLIDCLLIDWLRGALGPQHAQPEQMLCEIIAVCARSEQYPQEADREWQQGMTLATQAHGKPWEAVMRRLSIANIRATRGWLLSALSRTQGSSRDIRFVDAAAGLDVIDRLMTAEWAIPVMSAPAESWSPTWRGAGDIYNLLRQYLPEVLRAERLEIEGRVRRLDELLGPHPANEVLDVIKRLKEELEESRLVHSLMSPPAAGAKLDDLRARLQHMAAEQQASTFALELSEGHQTLIEAVDWLKYLEAVARQLDATERESAAREKGLPSTVTALSAQTEAEQLYSEIESVLADATEQITRKGAAA